jgi:hypothetical protein
MSENESLNHSPVLLRERMDKVADTLEREAEATLYWDRDDCHRLREAASLVRQAMKLLKQHAAPDMPETVYISAKIDAERSLTGTAGADALRHTLSAIDPFLRPTGMRLGRCHKNYDHAAHIYIHGHGGVKTWCDGWSGRSWG